MKRPGNLRIAVDLMLLMVMLPLVGVVFAGKSAMAYMEFPPLTRYVEHAGFSWVAFVGLAALTLGALLPFALRCRGRDGGAGGMPRASRPFPWWGWAGLAGGGVAWVLAWTRLAWFASLQPFTFSPLWLAYIVVVNALTYRRTGHCMLRDRPRQLLGLFLLSAGFWWFFEYLNRFVQNWYYLGVDGLSAREYFVFATLPFATVLPAVLGTYEWLYTGTMIGTRWDGMVELRTGRPATLAWVGLLTAALTLAGIGVWPDYLFPFLWLSPLLALTSFQALRGQPTVFSGLREGRWRSVALLALSALICGCFWEMWNIRSLAKWRYAVPFVSRFRLFEMPVLGYAGYLPFGLECAVVAQCFMKLRLPGLADPTDAVASPPRGAGGPASKRPVLIGWMVWVNAALRIGLAVIFLLAPGVMVLRDIADPNVRGPGIPRRAWRLHRYLTPRVEHWARERVASGQAGELDLYDVPSTEWPIFGCVYYLWATESLQRAWEQDPSLSPTAPVVYARDTIRAAADLVLDPVHHSWVRTHWGPDYLHTENVFFRSLIIAALTSRENLLGEKYQLDLLRDQVDTLSAELDASPLGWLDDYPEECYPIDILCAVALIQRADRMLGTDHSAFVAREKRAFEGRMLDQRGLIPYLVDSKTGAQLGPSRGIGNSYVLIFTPELWPELGAEWYRRYEQYFWQERWWAAGFREFPKDMAGHNFLYDVDAGPVIAGFSPAGNAFAVAACKINGRLDHAFTITAQVLAACWPLPNGALLGAKFLSNPVHAPYLGESCLLYFLSQSAAPGVAIVQGGRVPALVYIGYAFYFGLGALVIGATAWRLRRWRHRTGKRTAPYPGARFAAWLMLLMLAAVAFATGHAGLALLGILVSQFLPEG